MKHLSSALRHATEKPATRLSMKKRVRAPLLQKPASEVDGTEISEEKPVESSNQLDSNTDPYQSQELEDGSYQQQEPAAQNEYTPPPPQWHYYGNDEGIKFHEPGSSSPDLASPQGWQITWCPRWHGRTLHRALTTNVSFSLECAVCRSFGPPS